jgi:hypothetical protein
MKASEERLGWTKKRVAELVEWFGTVYDPKEWDDATRLDIFVNAWPPDTRGNEIACYADFAETRGFPWKEARANIRELATLARELATGEMEA